MTPKNSGISSEFDPLPDSAIVYRALLRKQWINEDTGRVSSNAYFLRKERNEIGLSVNIASTCSPEECAAKFRKCYGVASLNVGRIRELGLDVLPDSLSHGQIVGLSYVEDDRDRADRLARLLAKESRIVWQPSS